MKSQGRFFLWVVTDSWPSATPAMPRPNNPRVLEKIISKASGKEAGSCRKPGQAETDHRGWTSVGPWQNPVPRILLGKRLSESRSPKLSKNLKEQ